MNRRQFISSSAALGALSIGTGGLWFSQLEHEQDMSISTVRATLQNLAQQEAIFTGSWNAFQIFSHLAQSIEYSLSAYPQHKSDLFKAFIGQNVFRIFAKQGTMSHSLDEPIPGATYISNIGSKNQALLRLLSALNAFEGFTGELMPHFAYGKLSHAEYSLAHVMHIYNHLEEIHIG
jgi:hypothetical protein